ncbi:MAG: vWA domain-containing protein [Candidatus Riflemargulisbacteria bacterium]
MSNEKNIGKTDRNKIIASNSHKTLLKDLEIIIGKPVEPFINKEIYLLVDCSSSMGSDNKFQNAKIGGIGYAEEAIKKGYSVGIIQFGTDAEVVIESSANLNQVCQAINKLMIDGSTNMEAGIKLAILKLSKAKERDICIFTDGQPDNVENTLDAATSAKQKGIRIMCIGTEDSDKSFIDKLVTRVEYSVKVQSKEIVKGITNMSRLLPG